MKNWSFLGLNILWNLYFIKFRQNSGSSEADDVSEVSEPLGESCLFGFVMQEQIIQPHKLIMFHAWIYY